MKSIIEQRDLFRRKTNVSCETMQRLDKYYEFLQKEQKKTNLIGSGTLDKIWTRHFLDSAFSMSIIQDVYSKRRSNMKTMSLLDVGSGAGFPGIVLAILFMQENMRIKVFLAESNQKKAFFLKELVSFLKLNANVIPKRAELLVDKKFNFIVSRAVAPLDTLFNIVFPISSYRSLLIFYKGKNWVDEYKIIKKKWKLKSLVVKKNKYDEDSEGVVLIIEGLNFLRNMR